MGGYGTRLRPLTFSVPKPLVPFANLPIISHQIEALVRVGVKTIILAVNVQPETMIKFLKEAEIKVRHRTREDKKNGQMREMEDGAVGSKGADPFD